MQVEQRLTKKKRIKRVPFSYCQNCCLNETKYCQHYGNELGNKIGSGNKTGKFWCHSNNKHYMFVEGKE